MNSFASAVSNRYTFYKIEPCFWLTINLVKMVVNQDKISSYYSCNIAKKMTSQGDNIYCDRLCEFSHFK